MPKVFLSHNHSDKPFVRQLAADMAAFGVDVWVDEAEIMVGDSLVQKVSAAIDEVDYLAVILSPNSVSSRWVQEELQQALDHQMAGSNMKVLPILLRDCQMPGFLRGKLYADFRDLDLYDESLTRLLTSVGINTEAPTRSRLMDQYSARFDRVDGMFTRPKVWHCIYCGWKCAESFNDYICKQCDHIRPFTGGSATMIKCRSCSQFSLGIAAFCEWCGNSFRE